jgi:hypothetical protein
MNHLQGTTTVELNGVKRPVKFGTNQTAIFCQLRGITIKQAQEVLSSDKMKDGDFDMQVMIDLYYSAFLAGAKSARIEVDFDAIDVGDWFDEHPDLMEQVMEAADGANGPNGNRSQRRAAKPQK